MPGYQGSFHFHVRIEIGEGALLWTVDCSRPAPPGSAHTKQCDATMIVLDGLENGRGLGPHDVAAYTDLQIVSDTQTVVVLKKQRRTSALTLTVDFAEGILRHEVSGVVAARAEARCESHFKPPKSGSSP